MKKTFVATVLCICFISRNSFAGAFSENEVMQKRKELMQLMIQLERKGVVTCADHYVNEELGTISALCRSTVDKSPDGYSNVYEVCLRADNSVTTIEAGWQVAAPLKVQIKSIADANCDTAAQTNYP